jgi:hypothetical protein
MSSIAITLNHVRAVKAWADACDAQVNLDLRTFSLEVKARNRYYTLKPRFITVNQGKVAYAIELVNDVTGFIGWLPYDVLQWDLSQDKLLFKEFLKGAGLKSPSAWSSKNEIAGDFIFKDSVGSFGYQIAGPYRLDKAANVSWPPAKHAASKEQGVDFAEQFISGTNLKVWFWGAKAFYAHVHPYPTVTGDGRSTAQALVVARLASAGESYTGQGDQENLIASLEFQGVKLSDVVEQGREIWIDFRYGRRYTRTSPSADGDNDLEKVNAQVRQQIDLMGEKAAEQALRRFKAPVLYSVDGVVDAEGSIWWLEINSSPILPPEGYPLVFSSLFGEGRKS